MNTFDALLEYTYRQVVLNIYQDDELLSRDGFMFDTIDSSNVDRIMFIRNNQTIHEIKLDHCPRFTQLAGFPHHYAIEQNQLRIELYFP